MFSRGSQAMPGFAGMRFAKLVANARQWALRRESGAMFSVSSNKKLTLAIAGVLAACVSHATPEAADVQQLTASNGQGLIDTVLVTSRRRAENLQDVPVAITALGGEALLKADALKTGNDITQFIPNASASATDGRTRPRWFLRGIGTNETAASTVSPIGIYADDVYLNNVYIQGFPLFDNERVEVLRGPQGTLWGKNTTGGAINYISKKPQFDTEAYAKVTLGSYDERIIQGAGNAELLDDRVAGRLSIYKETRDGWVRNLAKGGRDGEVDDFAVRGQLLFNLTSNVDALVSVRHRELRGDKSPSFYVLGPDQVIRNPVYLGPQRGRDAIAQVGRAEENLDYDGASVTVNWSPGNYTLTSITSYDAGERVLFTGSPIALDISGSRAFADSEQLSQEIRLTSPQENRFSWIIGAHYFQEDLETDSVNRLNAIAGASSSSPAGTSPATWNREQYTQDTESTAVFASATLRVTEDFSLIAGVRWSEETKDFDLDFTRAASLTEATFNDDPEWWLPGSVTSPLHPVVSSSDSGRWSEVTYDFTPQYRFNDNVNAYLRYSHGFRAGGFVVDEPNNATRVPKRIDPETLDAYELGVKTQWLNQRLTVNTAAFYYDYKDIIVGVLLPVPGTANTRQVQENAGAGYSRGLEVEVGFHPTGNLAIRGSIGLLDTEYTRYSSTASGVTLNAEGNRFTRAPTYSQTLDVEYSVPLSSGAEISFGTDWSYRTKQYFNAVNQTEPTFAQDAYALGNARITYVSAGDRYSITGFVRNLTDEVYSVLATGNARGSSPTREVYGLPRTYGVSLSVKY
jgi:iron complex outermembrane receptor protein